MTAPDVALDRLTGDILNAFTATAHPSHPAGTGGHQEAPRGRAQSSPPEITGDPPHPQKTTGGPYTTLELTSAGYTRPIPPHPAVQSRQKGLRT